MADYVDTGAEDMRTRRAFVDFLGTALGVEQTYAGTDNGINSPTGQYRVIGSTGVAVEGVPRSSAQPIAQIGGVRITPGMVVFGLVIYLVLKR